MVAFEFLFSSCWAWFVALILIVATGDAIATVIKAWKD